MTPEEARQKAAELVADNQLDFTEVVAEWLMLQQKEPEKVKAVFSVDWSLLRATQDSLREHMAIAKAAQESERAFREQVAVALEELRGLINLEFIGDEFSDYNEGLRDALRHVDATIAALGLGGIPNCPDCGNNRQVWVNQITGKMTCHRAGCHKEI